MANRKRTPPPALPVWRHALVVSLLVGAVVVVAGRVVQLAVDERDFLVRQGSARAVRIEAVPAHRGVIYDRHGEPLAVSTPVVSVSFDAREELSAQQAAQLADALGYARRELTDTLAAQAGKSFVWLRRRLEPSVADRVLALSLPGVGLHREYRRYYPAGASTAHLVGVTDIDDQGLEGVELAFDDSLRGENGSKRVLRDRRGRNVKDLATIAPARFGRDLYLSIDQRLQYVAHRELEAAVSSHGARSGSLVMLRPSSGEVLALVNQPAYNPNAIAREFDRMRNRAVTDTFEPGSTVKPLTLIAALESDAFDVDSRVDTTPGFITVGKKLIQDPGNRGVLDLGGVLQKSSQVGVSKIVLALPEDSVRDAFARAGFGRQTGLGLPGEAAGSLPAQRDPLSRVALGYGYGFSVTPLQLAQGYAALANDGAAHPVTVLRHDRAAPPPPTQFEPDAARAVRQMLAGVVAPEGTAPEGAIAGFRVGGKTGTARKVGKDGYDVDRHVAWFAGIAPLDAPEFVLVVVIDEPKRGLAGGGDVAAPVFARVAERALRTLGVAPAITPEPVETAARGRRSPSITGRDA
ncbi:MAG: penicillin-binding protein 2 [Pseudomonadota bacterium]